MNEITTKTEKDYVKIIGETAFTAKNYREKRWNQYYFYSSKNAVYLLLKGERDRSRVLDVGCSHGSWFQTWVEFGFKEIEGVELSKERAEEAERSGFHKVYNADASSIPADSGTYPVACSNDVFLHVLQLKDKLAILKEVYRVLMPGGVFIFNFNLPYAYGHKADTVQGHCSFYSINTMLREVVAKTDFIIEDIRTTYYPRYSIFRKLLGYGIVFPFAVSLLLLNDRIFSRNLPLQQSSALYLKLRKRTG